MRRTEVVVGALSAPDRAENDGMMIVTEDVLGGRPSCLPCWVLIGARSKSDRPGGLRYESTLGECGNNLVVARQRVHPSNVPLGVGPATQSWG